MGAIVLHTELRVYQKAFRGAVEIFELSKDFPKEEMYGLIDQVRRSSQSVCANIAEAWRKRRYQKAFISKFSDAEGEAAETQVWLEFAVHFGYLDKDRAANLILTYDGILRTLVGMINYPHSWLLPTKKP